MGHTTYGVLTAPHCCLLCYLAGVGVPDRSLPFGITYNCLADGGDRITLIGTNFGVSGARISVNNRPCMDVQHLEAQSVVSCTIPPGPPGGGGMSASSS